MLTGERPGAPPGRPRAARASSGFEDFIAYVVWVLRARARARAAAAHEPRRRSAASDLARLREVTASQGLMLESLRPRPRRPPGLADQGPGAAAGRRSAPPSELRIPFTSGILVGIGETEDDRIAALEALAGSSSHLQEVILQNFVPHRRYYGEEPADIATEAAERYWRTGLARRRRSATCPAWATPVDDRGHEAAGRARRGG